jgi:alkaline phosphatase D
MTDEAEDFPDQPPAGSSRPGQQPAPRRLRPPAAAGYPRKMIARIVAIVAIVAVVAGFAAPAPDARASDVPAPAPDAPDAAPASASSWRRMHDRVWLGADVWANPLEDWRVADGWAECVQGGGGRSIHQLTHQLTDPSRSFAMEVMVRRLEEGVPGGGAGFRVGVRSEIDEYRSNCFAPGGITAGISGASLVLGPHAVPLPADVWPGPIRLAVSGTPEDGGVRLRLTAAAADGRHLGLVERRFPAADLLGNVALFNNDTPGGPRSQPEQSRQSRHAFTEWRISGAAFTVDPERRFGPILWSMYTVSDSRGPDGHVLKLAALTGPLGAADDQEVALEIEAEATWRRLGTARLDPDAWTATFRVPRWNAARATPFRILLRERWRDGTETVAVRQGLVRAEPAGRPLRMAGLTCQNDYAFPYGPVVENLARLDPDLLFFSGDQLYESHGGFGVIRGPAEPAIHNYLRKYYQFGWAFGDLMRSRPTIVLPDDHDVFQGNIWGEGGRPMPPSADVGASWTGGYIQPARMVNVVHRTCTTHHPDCADREPVEQDISVYHGDLVWGDVSFAIIADRQFKSGPEHVQTDGPRADHVVSPDFDTAALDKPGLVLLGKRQEEFLRRWSADWRGHRLKVLCSQTVFAGLATHHGQYDGYLKADLDCGGWPQSARNAALRAVAGSAALHVCGDQHLGSLVQYGIERPRDSLWAFCTPAIAVGYPRWWRPDDLGIPVRDRPDHGLANTGSYADGLGNLVFVEAVGNPEVGTAKHRYELAHQKGSGFGMITIDPAARTYRLEAFRFLGDATDGSPANQFPGWPVTLSQAEAGTLPPEPPRPEPEPR